jgi:FAD:protein FMN transferase
MSATGRATCWTMGTFAEIEIIKGSAHFGGAQGLANRAVRLLRELDERWSRSIPRSDVSRINDASGRWVTVHPSTRDVLLRAVEGWKRTQGRFDPTVHEILIDHGFANSEEFLRLRHLREKLKDQAVRPAKGCRDFRIDPNNLMVSVPFGTTIELDGIARGYAADLVIAQLAESGAQGAIVNIGGDVRVWGHQDTDSAWHLALEDPLSPTGTIATLRVSEGAVAMSTTTARRAPEDRPQTHRLMDPLTGRAILPGLSAVWVLAGEAWWAGVLARALLVAGPVNALPLLEHIGHGAQAFIVHDDGMLECSDGLAPFITLHALQTA